MNGAHDMGGMHGFGLIAAEPEAEEPVFHAEWEKRVFALTLAAGAMGKWNIDMSRFAREDQPPAQYLRNTYYQQWLVGLEKLLLQSGLVSEAELASGKAEGPVANELAGRVLRPERVAETMGRGDNHRVDEDIAPRFVPGERVVVRNRHPRGHTRAPRYVRGHEGVIDRDHGVYVFADANARGERIGQHCYSVRFSAQELWGPQVPEQDTVFVDLWDDHLDPA